MNQLISVAPDLWTVESTVELGLGASLPTRMTVIREQDGALTLISPVALTDNSLVEQLGQLGPVRSLIAPNLMHHIHLAAAKERYPNARVLSPPGLTQKRPELHVDALLEEGQLSPTLTALSVNGSPKLAEFVFLHHPSRSLIVTDLVFNVREARGFTWFVLKALSGCLGRLEQSRLLRSYITDRAAAAESIRRVLSLDFIRVIPAHGLVQESDARDALERGLWWIRGEKRRPSHRPH